VAWPAAPAVAASKAKEPVATASDARTDVTSVRPKADARPAPDAQNTDQRREPTTGMASSLTVTPVGIFLIVALGLAVAGILSRVVMRIAAARREHAVLDHSESDWIDDRQQHGFADERNQRAFVDDRHQHAWLDDRHQQDWVGDRSRHDTVDEHREPDWVGNFPTERIQPAATRPRDLAYASAEPLSPSVDDVEAALRVIMRARQRTAA
jgi:hypothetical protein